MRIIAGEKKGMKLVSHAGVVSRPFTDRVKESVFNILQNYSLPEKTVIADLFCGAGSMGLEALSRAAEFVVFVEKNHEISAILKKNIAKGGFEKKSEIINTDVFEAVNSAVFKKRKYNLVFVDPPFALTKDAGSFIERLSGLFSGQLDTGAIVVIRTHKSAELPESYGRLTKIMVRTWGINKVTLLRNSGNDE